MSASVREKGLKWQAEPKLFEMYTWLYELFEKVEYGTTFSVHAYMCSILFHLGKTPRGGGGVSPPKLAPIDACKKRETNKQTLRKDSQTGNGNGPFFLKAALWVDSHGEIGSEYLSAAVRSI